MGKRQSGFPSVVPWIVAAVVFTVALLTLETVHHKAAASEPDQYFHLALGRQMAENGLQRKLPQAEQVGWHDRFTNDYFLFSALIAGAWKVGGEKAALYLVPLLSLALCLLLFGFAKRYLPWGLALALPFFLLLSPTTLPRLLTLRPSLLAEACLVGMAWAIVGGSRVGVTVCAAVFALSYHAVYFPAFVLLAAAGVGHFFGNGWPKIAAYGAGGLLAGIVLHPYFPHTLPMIGAVVTSLLVPSAIPSSELAMEAQGWSKELFLGRLPLFALILGFTTWRLLAEPLPTTKAKKAAHPLWDPEFVFLFVLSLCFCALVFVSFRAIEYAAPFTLLFFAVFVARHTRGAGQAAGVVAVGALLLLPDAARLLTTPLNVLVEPVALRSAVEAIPDGAGKKVFNCDWFTGGPLLYLRPELRFVDLGDPHAVEAAHPGLSALKSQLRHGDLPYLLGPVRYAFGADYVLCQGSPLVEAMDASPHFRRVFPSIEKNPAPVDSSVFTVHEVRPAPSPAFVTEFEQEKNGKWVAWEAASKLTPEQRSPFLSLGREFDVLERTVAAKAMECTTVRPTREELRRHQGAEYLGMGGGPALLVEFNGRRLFARQHWAGFRSLDTFVPLPHRLLASDRLVVKACRLSSRSRLGAAVSLWTGAQLKETCQWKGMPLTGSVLGGADFADQPMSLCLGTLAARNGLH